MKTTKEFRAETKRLLNLSIHPDTADETNLIRDLISDIEALLANVEIEKTSAYNRGVIDALNVARQTLPKSTISTLLQNVGELLRPF